MINNIHFGNTAFIQDQSYGCWFDNIPYISLFCCRFNKEAYSDDLFNQHRIAFPDTLKNAVPKRKAEFLAGRYCANKVLNAQGIHNFVIHSGEHRGPIWPENIFGTISHSVDYAVAAACRPQDYAGIGIDIEELISLETLEKIHSQIIYQEETSLIAQSTIKKSLLFTLIFSIKESFFKAAYPLVKNYFHFDAITVLDIQLTPGIINFRLNITLHDSLVKGSIYQGYLRKLDEKKIVTLFPLLHKQ